MPVLKIVSRKEGFRRAGYAFGAAPVEIDASTLTQEQIAALKAEPMLIVVEGSFPDNETAPQKKAAPTPKTSEKPVKTDQAEKADGPADPAKASPAPEDTGESDTEEKSGRKKGAKTA